MMLCLSEQLTTLPLCVCVYDEYHRRQIIVVSTQKNSHITQKVNFNKTKRQIKLLATD